MKNIIFDFDSTLISTESLEMILDSQLINQPKKIKEIEKITNMGMDGSIGFRESLEQRLAIAQPTKQAIDSFVDMCCPRILTSGISELVKQLQQRNINIFIFSGGLADSIRPFAKYLNIVDRNIFAVEVNWDSGGNFDSLNNANGACESKLHAFESAKALFDGETTVVGDGYTDYQLYKVGYVDKFIAYCEHVKRDSVVNVAGNIANNVDEIKELIF